MEAISLSLRQAFKHAPRPDDSELFDDYPNLHPEEEEHLQYLKGKSWKQIDMHECGFAIMNLSVDGWRYFLPAYLLDTTSAWNDTGFYFGLREYWLCPTGQHVKHSLERVSSLSRAEFDAGKEYVRFAKDCADGEARSVWRNFWNQAAFGDFPEVV
ncbi:MAG TPA: DUF6714 family protein [Fimbriimonas sp.]|nr:DUF6714 family protein [Fimbriimonas sp.]